MATAEYETMSSDQLIFVSEALVDSFRKSLNDCFENLNNQKCDAGHPQDLTQLKSRRGLDTIYVQLQTGFVVETTTNGRKIFINICYNDFVQLPSKNFSEAYENHFDWTLSYFLSHLKNGHDEYSESYICDIVFHPIMSEINHIYQYNIAFKCIEKHHNIYLDINNTKFLDFEYIGCIERTLLTNYIQGYAVSKNDCNSSHRILNHLYERLLMINDVPCKDEKPCPKHQCKLSVQELFNDSSSKIVFSVLTLHLPLHQMISFDILEKSLLLLSQLPFSYDFNISLPFALNEDCSKEMNDNHHLLLTLPTDINRFNSAINSILFMHDDSGVESDIGSPEHNFNKVNNYHYRNSLIEKMKTFFDVHISYLFPSFNVSTSDNIIMFALNIKNVKSDSLAFIYINNYLCLKCCSEGLGNDLSYYAFVIKVHFRISEIQTEIWDNTITIQFMVNLVPKKNNSPVATGNRLAINISDTSVKSSNYQCEFNSSSNEVLVKNKSRTRNTSEPNKIRSISESSEDTALLMKRSVVIKGILKSASISRSVSESSVDDHYGFTMSLDRDFDTSFEFTSTSLDPCKEHSSSNEVINKKTVRFKDVVSKQVFRSNSSILGQKKKNQRKNRNKKRAHDRRMSESENSECEEKEISENINCGKNVINNTEEMSVKLKELTIDNSKNTNSSSSRNDLIFPIDI